MTHVKALTYFTLGLLIAVLSHPGFGQNFAGVLTSHNDNARTGQNQQETILTTANVNFKSFGKLFSDPIQGQAYAQPLYVPGVSIPGQGTRNVVYVVPSMTKSMPLTRIALDIPCGTLASSIPVAESLRFQLSTVPVLRSGPRSELRPPRSLIRPAARCM